MLCQILQVFQFTNQYRIFFTIRHNAINRCVLCHADLAIANCNINLGTKPIQVQNITTGVDNIFQPQCVLHIVFNRRLFIYNFCILMSCHITHPLVKTDINKIPQFLIQSRYYIYTTSVTARSPPSRDNCTTRIFCFISLIKSARLYAGCVCKILSANAAYAASADSA